MRIDGLALPQLINIKGLNDILGKLLVGDKLEAQVVEMDGGELTLRLPNGQNVSATAAVPIELNLGDFLQLAVKSKNDSQIVLQTVVDAAEQTKVKDVGDTLMSLKLPPDERNFEIGTAMINQHLPLNADNLKTVFNVLGTFENMDIEKAVFIAANNIQTIPEGKELLDKFENNQISVGNSVNNLIELMTSNIDEQTLGRIFSDFETEAKSKVVDDNNNEIQNIVSNYTGSGENDENLVKLFVKQAIAQSNNPKITAEAILNQSYNTQSLQYLLEPKNNKEICDFISQKPVLQEKLLSFLSNKESINNFIQNFSKDNPAILGKLINIDSRDKAEIIRSFFEDAVNSIKGGRIKKEINVNKLYSDLEIKLDVIEKHLANNSVPNGEKIEHVVEQLKSEIGFIKNVDNMYNFYQLPFVINQNSTTVDMYMLKNNREHRKIDPDNATMFLSLNTQNLGLVEVLIHVQNKVVSFNFRLENERTIGFFENRQIMLENLLSSKGYTSGKMKYILNSKKTNVVNFGHLVREDKSAKTVFDVKI